MTAQTSKKGQNGFSKEQIETWRRQRDIRREELFKKSWKNQRPVVAMRSRTQEQTFQFVLEWYEEFGEVVGRTQERARLDRLLAQGLDVNAPENKK